MRLISIVTCCALLAILSACGDSSRPPVGTAPPAIKVGNPYTVNGTTYIPAPQPEYDEIGMASWYGPGFHGKRTANGEKFNQHDITAAHRTLPMPSLVRVTNLINGRIIIVRINDRGPFSKDRIIDLSQGAAEELGMKGAGLAKVRVQFLPLETQAYLDRISPPEKTIAYPEIENNDDGPEEAPYAVEQSRIMAEGVNVGAVEQIDLAPAELPSVPAQAKPEPAIRTVLDAPETQKEVNITSPAAHGGWFIQAGSFSLKENAQKMVKKISPLGNALISNQFAAGRNLFRVRLGPVHDKKEAEALLDQVLDLGVYEARIVKH